MLENELPPEANNGICSRSGNQSRHPVDGAFQRQIADGALTSFNDNIHSAGKIPSGARGMSLFDFYDFVLEESRGGLDSDFIADLFAQKALADR